MLSNNASCGWSGLLKGYQNHHAMSHGNSNIGRLVGVTIDIERHTILFALYT